MKTLHDSDSGYLSFYNDVLTELDKHYSNVDYSKLILNEFELWVEEAFYYPDVEDNILPEVTAIKIIGIVN